jgi:hypothetical protein
MVMLKLLVMFAGFDDFNSTHSNHFFFLFTWLKKCVLFGFLSQP